MNQDHIFKHVIEFNYSKSLATYHLASRFIKVSTNVLVTKTDSLTTSAANNANTTTYCPTIWWGCFVYPPVEKTHRISTQQDLRYFELDLCH